MSGAVAKVLVEGVSRRYGSVTALDHVSLEVREGEFLTLLGPSGSGKTTLLMILAGLLEPSSGRVWIDGKDATALPSFRRDIGMVFQNYALFPHLTIFENIAFPLRMRKMPHPEIAAKVAEVLQAVELPHVAQRLPRELSGGQQQRIALARCIVYRPSIILMDEPLGALDKKLRDKLQLEIKRLHVELGITVLYVTHDQEEAMVLSDRICLMNGGAIEQLGSASQLYFSPRTLFSARFLGESNVLAGELTESGPALAQMQAGALRLAGRPNGDFAPGERVSCMVRPECVRVLEDGEAADNELQVTVKDVIVVGGTTRIYSRVHDGSELLCVQLTSNAGAPLRPGTPLRVGWRSQDCVLLPGDDPVAAH